MTNMYDEINAKNEALQANLENGTYTHVGLMQCQSKIGNGVMFLMAYDFDKNWQHIQPVFSEEQITKGLADCASKYNLIDEGLLVDGNFDPIIPAVEMGIRNNKLGDIDDLNYDLNYDRDLADRFKEVENSFAVEADLKSGSMLAPDRDKLIEIMKMRNEVLETVNERGGTDNMLAIEKVFVDGEKNPLEISCFRMVIGAFHHLRENSGEEYKSKVEKAQSKGIWKDLDGVPFDDGLHDLFSHSGNVGEKAGRVLNILKNSSELEEQLSTEEGRVLLSRMRLLETLRDNYKDLQREALQPEKETVKTKEAGAEIGM